MLAAARSGDAGEIRRLVAGGADVEESDARGRRPMHMAAEHGHVDVLRTLAELGAKLDPQDKNGETPWVYAHTATVEDNGAAEALNALGLEHPGDVIIAPSSYTPDGTPVYTVPPELRASHALLSGPASRAQISEQGGRFADGRPFLRVRSITAGMFNELMKASALGNVAQIKSLVAGGVDVETQDDLGWRPIHMAAERGQPKSVRALAKLGADLNAPDSKGTLPLYWAAIMGHVETVKVLVEVGADTEALMSVGGLHFKITPLQFAVCQRKLGAIRVLAQCGADVDASADDGNKAVHLAAMNDQEDVMVLLWELGADLSAALVPPADLQLMSANSSSVCVNGFTPLQLSVEYKNVAVARVIKELQHTTPPPPGACAACGADGGGVDATAFQRCARCKCVKYCSKECQRTHWRTHKASCVAASGS
jgi:ankyrin repeat protein